MKKYNLESNEQDSVLAARPWLSSHAGAVHPILTAQDVKDAASSWSVHHKHRMSFEEFKQKLTVRAEAIGKKGSLPKKWKK